MKEEHIKLLEIKKREKADVKMSIEGVNRVYESSEKVDSKEEMENRRKKYKDN
jgi:hypothetical protein